MINSPLLIRNYGFVFADIVTSKKRITKNHFFALLKMSVKISDGRRCKKLMMSHLA